MSEKEVRQAIITALSNETGGQIKSKELCKSVMKAFKSQYDGKDERKEVFAKALEKLVSKDKVSDKDGVIQLVTSDDKHEKKSKKRKADDEPKVVADESSEYKLMSSKVANTTDSTAATAGETPAATEPKVYPVPTGNNTILLFYAYCNPQMTRGEQDEAIGFCYKTLNGLGMTGRLRIAREGFNSTLTGSHDSVRTFTSALRKWKPETFGETDFKYVDNLPDQQLLKGLKVWPVTEIVTYGFDPLQAPLDMRGTHLTPQEFHNALAKPNTVVIDVRNFNESVIGKFAPPTIIPAEESEEGVEKVIVPKEGEKVLDPMMRRSTEFPSWIDNNRDKLEGKQVLMYCTAGVRCERASAFMRNKGIENVFQLEGGIHRYLDAFPEDGGYWVGKNYTFDKRFNHGAKASVTISECVYCHKPWDRYQAQSKCCVCSMEVLLCKDCQRMKPAPPKKELFCPLCVKK